MLNSFKNPPPEHRVHALWQWNTKLDPDEVERQIREMHRQGFGGFVIEHGPETLANNSEQDLVKCLDRAARTAANLEMRAFLHDPSHGFDPPQEPVWSKFLYLLGNTDRSDGRNPTACKKLQLLGQFAERFWSVPIEEVKGAVDWQMSLGGATMLAPRVPFENLSMPFADHDTGHDQGRFYNLPGWPYQRLLVDYVARLSFALSQGRSKAQVALLHTGGHDEAAKALAAKYVDLYCRSMLREHISFDIITEDALANSACVDQRIRVGSNDYEALILPPTSRMRPRVARKVRDFADDGGVLVGTGLLPYAGSRGAVQPWIRSAFQGIFGLDPVELEREAASGNAGEIRPLRSQYSPVLFFSFGREAHIARRLRVWLEGIMKLDVSARWRSVECPDITYAHRVLGSGEIFFFANNSAEAREVQLGIRCSGAPHVLDPETGESAALSNCTQRAGRTVLLHRFERHGSLLVYFGSEPALRVRKQTSGLEGREVAVLDGWDDVPEVGCAVCSADVDVPGLSRGESVVLRADDPAGVVEFAVNSVQAGVRAWAPFEVDVTHLVRPETGNLIEIKDVRVSLGRSNRATRRARVAIC